MVTHFIIDKNDSTANYEQTDWGGIYHNTPSEYFEPDTIEQLAQVLKQNNKLNKLVTIRNTGHSVNGQTLTNAVQVSLKKLKTISFDEESMLVTCSAGNTWDEVLQSVHFPKYCTPLFPNNPGQKIQIGGTAAVGGVGVYCSQVGGLWDHIVEIKLVTMTGEIITCNYKENFDLMRFALGGYGRIGVVAEMKVRVVESAEYLCMPLIPCYSEESFYKTIQKANELAYFDGIFGLKIFKDWRLVGKVLPPYAAVLIKELKSGVTSNDVFDFTYKNLHKLPLFSIVEETSPKHIYDIDVAWGPKIVSKKDFTYTFLSPVHEDQWHGLHPWGDYIIGKKAFPDFVKIFNKTIKKYGMEAYQLKEGFFNSVIDVPTSVIYSKKFFHHNQSPFMLSPTYGIDDEFLMGITSLPTVPISKLADAISVVHELTDAVYELGGKQYLYGFHDLSISQIRKHYGDNTIMEWNLLKNKLDPKHLLNIGVLPHLDRI